MKRKTKNIIIITLIIILGIASGFTVKLAKDSVSTNSENVGQNMGTPPDQGGQGGPGQNDNNAGQNQSDNSMGQNQGTPPAKPDGSGDNSNMSEPPTMPNENNGNSMGEPPTKPDDSNGNSTSESPTKPEDGSNNDSSEMPTRPSDNNNGMPTENRESKEINIEYYILFGVEAFLISLLIAFLIMSNFNKKTIAMTLSGAKNIVILVLIVAILTAVLTVAQAFIANKLIETNQTQSGMQASNGMKMPGGNGGASSNVTYTASKEITEDATISSGEYSSTTADENALLASGDIDVRVSNVNVTKTGDSDGGDSSNFYGNNSAVLAKDGANLTLDNITVATTADGANGVFSYGGSATTNNSSSDGTTVTISNSNITTTGDNAGGIMTTGGGTTNATNLTINTSGTSSAAIRSDRGGGKVNVEKGTYTTTGQGSPSIYSTADITVKDATLVAKASEGIVIEGANTVTIENCDLTDSNTKLNGQSITYKNVFLYQSMSGDASNGTATFTAKNSNITTNNGDTFYITNTTATINLENNTIINNDSTGNFLRAQKDSWGKSGSNGGNVTLKMTNQKAEGNIVIDSISTLDMEMAEGSYYEGTINGANEAKSITLKLDSTSKIKLTGNSYVTSLEDEDSTYSHIDFNGYTLYVNGVAIN